jgi:hypothetical protein
MKRYRTVPLMLVGRYGYRSGVPTSVTPTYQEIITLTNLCTGTSVADPDHLGKPDPDPHQSEKSDPDPHQSEKPDPDPHQSEKPDPDPHRSEKPDPDPQQ